MPEHDPLDRVVGALHGLGMDMDTLSIAEVLWLAAFQGRPSGIRGEGARREAAGGRTAEQPEHRREPDAGQDPDPQRLPLYDPAGRGDTAVSPAYPVSLPRGRALPGARELTRSLRPLKRSWPQGRRMRLDMTATVSDYARSGELIPAFRPAPERWFDGTVVVDRSATMAVWGDTTAELLRLLSRAGIFRTLRVWDLNTQHTASTASALHGPLGQRVPEGGSRSSQPRRLTLVVSDCASAAWRDERLWRRLHGWAKAMPTVLVNPLPPRTWRTVGLDLPAVRVTSPGRPGVRNSRLRFTPPPLMEEAFPAATAPGKEWLAVPAVSLSPRAVGNWARTLMRADPAGCEALLLPAPGVVDRAAAQGAPAPVDARTAAESFLLRASPAAARLAVLCSPYEEVKLPLLRLIQHELVPEATTADLAEFVVGGLVTFADSGTAGTAGDAANAGTEGPALRFRSGVREQLEPRLGERDLWRFYDALERYSAMDAEPLCTLPAVVPGVRGRAAVAAGRSPFAEASLQTLRALGMAAEEAPVEAVQVAESQGATEQRAVRRQTPAPAPQPQPDPERIQPFVDGPDGRQFRLVDAPAQQPISDVPADLAAKPAPEQPPPVGADSPRESPRPPREPGRRRGTEQRPYFFLSYAHTPRYGAGGPDPDMWVERLFRDLCGHVMAMTDLPAGTPAGFMDREIRSGEGWSERMGQVLAECKVFVPLFSPRYFASEMCGKEWFVFAQRAIHHRARSARPAEAIVPALWVPTPPEQLPAPAERLQFNHRAFGDRYVTDGLYGLIKLRIFAEEYERAVYELAKRIVSVAEHADLPAGQPVDYRQVPSAFGSPRAAGTQKMQITVAAPGRDSLPEGRSPDYYGAGPQDWNPYHPESARPLADTAQDLVRALNYRVTVSTLGEAQPLDKRQPPLTPEILLVDRWALRDDALRERLAAFDAEPQPWTSVVVPWNRADHQSRAAEAELTELMEVTLPTMLRQGRAASRAAARGITSMEAFAQILPQVVESAAQQFLRHSEVYPPSGGSSVERPRLRGPVTAEYDPKAHQRP
ncbi:TIR-like protein FxsC [Streptomyces sp. ISL-98]|uniref:TIR-like protein FxsC n=1 Tax=Streptomyces sp. ISL-98 TaxID=2819192 RepID=UPI0027E45D74|nr:TIR-like protein FxsC [Streptomyces sp. ISL-98]